MKLCVNYLMELRELFDEVSLDYLDYIKLYSINNDLSPFDWCISKKDMILHGLIGTISNVGDRDFLDNRDFDLLRDYLKRGKTPYISAHINRTTVDERNEDEVLEDIKENVKKLKEIMNERIILENVPAHVTKNIFISSPEFITKVVKECNTGFLFDIGHARHAAEILNIPFDEYVSRLPMDRVIELHLAGSMRLKDKSLIANHSKMNEEDYEFLEMALDKYKTLETITLEYGPFLEENLDGECVVVSGDSISPIAKAEILEQLTRIHEIMKKHGLK